jgi:hypothetical protein
VSSASLHACALRREGQAICHLEGLDPQSPLAAREIVRAVHSTSDILRPVEAGPRDRQRVWIAGQSGLPYAWGACLVALATALSSGCGPHYHPISYALANNSQGAALTRGNGTLNVKPFRDVRQSRSRNEVLFKQGAESKIGDKRRCINSERNYKPGSVARQVTAAVAGHLRHRGAFSTVSTGNNPRADYQLRGNIAVLFGMQNFHWGDAVARSFGMIGHAIASGSTSETEVHVLLTGLVLTDRTGNIVARLPNAAVDFEGQLPADSHCQKIFDNVNNKLREAVEKLALSLEQALMDRASNAGWGNAVAVPRPSPAGAPMPASPEDAQAQPDVPPAPEGTPCVPSCRQGFVCSRGRCVSPCNPPCAAGEVCSRGGHCVPTVH